MAHKTIKVCQSCGAHYEGTRDCHYCPKCAKEKKLDTVVRIRICQDCRTEFYGGPRARRCSECSFKAKQERNRKFAQTGAARPLGSTDICAICRKEYIVKSGKQKYCSADCQRVGVLAWQRAQRKGYNKSSGQDIKKQKRREEQQKICVYCLRPFKTKSSTNICSDYCKAERKKMQMCQDDIKRGKRRNLQKYVDAMMAYREQVNKD